MKEYDSSGLQPCNKEEADDRIFLHVMDAAFCVLRKIKLLRSIQMSGLLLCTFSSTCTWRSYGSNLVLGKSENGCPSSRIQMPSEKINVVPYCSGSPLQDVIPCLNSMTMVKRRHGRSVKVFLRLQRPSRGNTNKLFIDPVSFPIGAS